MSDVAVIVTGDHAVLSVALTKDKSAFNIDPSASVKAAVVSQDRGRVILPAVSCFANEAGADWASSLVVAKFSDTATIDVTDIGPALLEMQVDDGGKLTWFADAVIVQGNIA